MNFITKLLGSKAAVTSAGIRAEINKAEIEAAALRDKIEDVMDGIAAFSDEQHVTAEASVAALRRAITRLEARANTLAAELPTVIAAEKAAQKAEADKALKDRAEACRKANTVEAKKLLADYDRLASQMGDIFQRLDKIAEERNAINKELKDNPVADDLPHWHDLFRKQPDRQAFVRRELRPAWVFSNGDVEPAQTDSDGNVICKEPQWVHHLQRFEEPRLERREIIVARGDFRPGMSEAPLPTSLAAGFAGGEAHWPRS
jgi:hypothetical protein